MKRFVGTTHAFDPETEQWEKLPDAPYPFSYAAFTVAKNRLYVLGGYDGQKERREILQLEKRDGVYSWEIVGELPESSLFPWAGAVGSSIYLLGGVGRFEPYDDIGTCCTSRTATRRLMVWDTDHPETGWRQLPPYPGPRRWIFTADTDGESIWMFGGRYQENADGPTSVFNDVARYRIDEGAWESLPALPEATDKQRPLVALHVDRKVLLMSYEKTVWEFDVAAHTYTKTTPLPQKVFVDRFFWFDGQILGAGGENDGVGPRRRSEWTFFGEFKTSPES